MWVTPSCHINKNKRLNHQNVKAIKSKQEILKNARLNEKAVGMIRNNAK